MLGTAVLGFILLVALLTPVLMNHDPTLPVPQSRFSRPMSEAAAPGTGTYIFGTDNLGRDVYSRVAYGGRVSLTVGFGAVAISLALATVIGVSSAYVGGWYDAILQRVE